MIPFLALLSASQAPITITVHADRPGAPISPSLYGIFFEEINQAGDGGLYAELLRNRGLETAQGPNDLPEGWKSVSGATLIPSDGPNDAHPRSIRIPAGGSVENLGFWGVPVKANESYRLILWAKGPGTAKVGFGSAPVSLGSPGEGWKRFERTIKAGNAGNTRLTIAAEGGPVSVAFASLMPVKTWKGRENGLRPDLAEAVNNMKPDFVRFPGGCYVEGGDRFSDAFDWKRSVGPIDNRKGLAHSMWGYPNTFGLGYHEYLQWCEDLGADPLFVVNCGINHRQVTPMAEMGKWVNDALDAIEYANGPVTSKWGALRAKNGHPKPFGLKYVEIGNENGGWFNAGNEAYIPRYRLIFDAIKAKYPNILTVCNQPLPGQPMEIVDEHYYESPSWFWQNAHRYDTYDRKGPKIYVGEYAVTKGSGTGNLDAALGEAAFMAGMERNADVVKMASYAPLFVNVNNRQWNPNAIVFDAQRSYGTPSYYVQALFANNRPERNVAVSYPATEGTAPKPGGGIGLMTWNTKTEFRDIVVTENGKQTYSSAGIGASGLEQSRGDWSVTGDTITQSALETDRTVRLKNALPKGDYTLTLKARKLEGLEGFIVMLDQTDGGGLQWNVGGWQNRETAFQRNGAVVGRSLPHSIESNHWYDVRIEREGNRTRGYLDGKLVQEIVERGAPDLTAVAGIDTKAKELVLKVVNGSDDGRAATLDLAGQRVGGTAKVTVLTGPSLLAENSFDDPKKIAPVTSTLSGVAPGMSYTFAPRSVTVLRIPIR
jgi:alpha-L-arabinofuranosidase